MTSEPARPSADAPGLSSWDYLRPYRRPIIWGVAMLLATNLCFLGIPVLQGKIVRALQGEHPAANVPRLAIYMVIFAFATALTRIWSRVAIFNAARSAEYDLRSRLFGHLLRFEPGFFRRNSTGDVMSRLTNDVATVRGMWGAGILNVVNTGFAFTTVLVMMLRIDPILTLWAILPYPTIMIVGRVMGRRIYKNSMGVQEQLGKLSGSIQEDLTGIGIIKTYGIEEERKQHFRAASEVLLERNMALTAVRGQLVPVLSALGSIGTVIVIWFGGRAVIGGRIGLGDMVEFNGYLIRLVWPTLALGWMLSLMQRGMASWSRLSKLLGEQPRIADPVALPAGEPPGDTAADARPLDPATIRGEVEIRNLTIEIDGRKLLDRVSLTLPAGSVTAIVGRTGSGKSTLVAALPRLLELPPGTVFLDGRDVTRLPLETVRGAIGFAPQEAFLFSTTIARNIAVGIPRGAKAGAAGDADPARDAATAAADPRVRQAAEAAGLIRDLSSMPDGFDTIVGERGITLSGGQRQRVALARALARTPRVLVLDDSLSSVDAETEQVILGHLTRMMEGRTAVLISHRVAAMRRADQIVVLDHGRVVEQGHHDELLARGGIYAEVYQAQLDETIAAVGGAA